jgi:serine/threonine protein kinase
MGVVYLARNRHLGRNEVLKVMAQRNLERDGLLDRFLREINTVAHLCHPNIVSAYTAFRLGENIIFAMEYVNGHDLAWQVEANGPLPIRHACSFAHQAALGLQHAHEAGMVHRDIKPNNLMLARKGNKDVIKVLDFGVARVIKETSIDGALTSAGDFLGTPDFVAPEQITDARKADIRADVYSLGCTLYYLLTGGPPFRRPNLYDILQAHKSVNAEPLNFVRPEVPVELAKVVDKMMAKDPARRYQTPAEVAEALEPFFKKGTEAFPESGPAPPALALAGSGRRGVAVRLRRRAGDDPQRQDLERDDRAGRSPERCRGFRRRREDHRHVAGGREARGNPSRPGSTQGRGQEGRVRDIREGTDRQGKRVERDRNSP